jgi:hypothetical protein
VSEFVARVGSEGYSIEELLEKLAGIEDGDGKNGG